MGRIRRKQRNCCRITEKVGETLLRVNGNLRLAALHRRRRAATTATFSPLVDYTLTAHEPLSVSEESLVKEIQADPRKFGDLFEAFYENIFGYAFRRTACYDAARDIAAETFFKAYIGIGKFSWRNIPVQYWLYRIATNEINKHYRRRSYTPDSLQRLQEEYGLDLTDHRNAESERIRMEEDLQKHREFMKVRKSMAMLDRKYQDVISLRYFEQKTIRDMAVILRKKEGTIKSLLSRGIEKLREHLIGEENEKG